MDAVGVDAFLIVCGECLLVGVCRPFGGFVLLHGGPFSVVDAQFQQSGVRQLHVLVGPGDFQLAGAFRIGAGELAGCFIDHERHELIFLVVADAGVHLGVEFAQNGQPAVLVDFGAVGLTVPVGVAFHVGEAVPLGEHIAHHVVVPLLVLDGIGAVAVEDAVVVPRGSPDELGNPQRTFVSVVPSLQLVEQVPFGPVAVQVHNVAPPAAGVDGVHERIHPVEAAVVRGR